MCADVSKASLLITLRSLQAISSSKGRLYITNSWNRVSGCRWHRTTRKATTALGGGRQDGRWYFAASDGVHLKLKGDPNLVEYSKSAADDASNFTVVPNFVSEEEEARLMKEIERAVRGKRFLYRHWDGVSTH